MKNLKTLLLPLVFSFCIHNGAYSQKTENPKGKRIYIKEHIKNQIKACYYWPDYYSDFDREKDTLQRAGFVLKNKHKDQFNIISNNGVQKKEILFLINKYDDPMSPPDDNIEAGVEFNRYFFYEKNKNARGVNADEIKVYKIKGYK